ncbi:hypothetical protein EGI32_14270 [Ferruginibacter sp. HRS2-29]|nr:hypothetical protein [Ferruginibacter sp. HRS2-29]
MGSHKYIKNGVVIDDYLPVFNQVGQTKKGSLFIWLDWHHPKPDTLDGMLADPLKKKSQHIDVIYVAGAIPQLLCTVYSSEGMIFPPTLPGVTLPENFTLIKQ